MSKELSFQEVSERNYEAMLAEERSGVRHSSGLRENYEEQLFGLTPEEAKNKMTTQFLLWFAIAFTAVFLFFFVPVNVLILGVGVAILVVCIKILFSIKN